jgi:hypothetical protein
MEESHRKGVANRLASSLAEAVARLPSKRRQRYQWGRSVSGTLLGAPGVAEGIVQSKLRNRLRYPRLRTVRPASLNGMPDIFNVLFRLWVVQPPHGKTELGKTVPDTLDDGVPQAAEDCVKPRCA